jgi:hypothetical protein
MIYRYNIFYSALQAELLLVEGMMARFLPYICFIILNLLLCMEAQAGRLGLTPDDEGEVVFLFSLSLSLYMFVYEGSA